MCKNHKNNHFRANLSLDIRQIHNFSLTEPPVLRTVTLAFARYQGELEFYSSGFFATQKPLHYPSFLTEELNKRLKDYETLQVSPSKFLATPKTSFNRIS